MEMIAEFCLLARAACIVLVVYALGKSVAADLKHPR